MRYLLKSLISKRQVNHNFINCFARYISQGTYEKTNHDRHQEKFFRTHASKVIIGTSITALLAFNVYDKHKNVFAKEPEWKEACNIGAFREGLPFYTLEEVAEHASKEKRIWVTYKEGVYDITSFVTEHPGGEQILLAAGSSVEPFWLLYGVHNNPHVLSILETLRIGNLSKEESQQLMKDMSDPYSNDPKRHAALKPASVKPFNAEAPTSILVDHFLTPNELFYVRNHLPVPEIDPETYELEVEVEGTIKKLSFTLDELKQLPKRTITATIMCAGNRRSEMTKVKPVRGLNWGPAAVGNATWTGVPLRDVLIKAGINEDNKKYKHVHFGGADLDPTGNSYAASIPFWKAIDRRGDVILAYEMNGVPIPRDHGFPVRVIVPGTVGARNVKWLERISVSEEESNSHWQQNDYKGFSPSTDWDTVDFTKSPSIQELPVISAICKPSVDEVVKVVDGHILVKGYAWSGGGQNIVRVDVTVDEGETWHTAGFDFQDSAEPPQHWSWTVWSVRVPVERERKKVEIWVKATDSCYNTQPESFKNIWNLRGVLGNAYHRVPVTLA